MVTNQASIKRNGVQDYVSLRATAFIIALYTFFIAGFFSIIVEYIVCRDLRSSVTKHRLLPSL